MASPDSQFTSPTGRCPHLYGVVERPCVVFGPLAQLPDLVSVRHVLQPQLVLVLQTQFGDARVQIADQLDLLLCAESDVG